MNRSRVKLVLETTSPDGVWKEVTHTVVCSERDSTSVGMIFDHLVSLFDELRRCARLLS